MAEIKQVRISQGVEVTPPDDSQPMPVGTPTISSHAVNIGYLSTYSTSSLFKTTGSKASPTSISASGITPANARLQVIFVQGNGGAVDITANPQIAAGNTIGDRLTLVGCSDTNTLALDHGTGLVLNGQCILREYSSIDLIWDGTNWVETARNDI